MFLLRKPCELRSLSRLKQGEDKLSHNDVKCGVDRCYKKWIGSEKMSSQLYLSPLYVCMANTVLDQLCGNTT